MSKHLLQCNNSIFLSSHLYNQRLEQPATETQPAQCLPEHAGEAVVPQSGSAQVTQAAFSPAKESWQSRYASLLKQLMQYKYGFNYNNLIQTARGIY